MEDETSLQASNISSPSSASSKSSSESITAPNPISLSNLSFIDSLNIIKALTETSDEELTYTKQPNAVGEDEASYQASFQIKQDVRRTFRHMETFYDDNSPLCLSLLNVLSCISKDFHYVQGTSFFVGALLLLIQNSKTEKQVFTPFHFRSLYLDTSEETFTKPLNTEASFHEVIKEIDFCFESTEKEEKLETNELSSSSSDSVSPDISNSANQLAFELERDCYQITVGLLQKHGLKDLWSSSLITLQLRLFQLKSLIQQKLPKLSRHLDSIGIHPRDFATSWFLTLFSQHFPETLFPKTRGWKAVFRVCLCVLHFAQEDLLGLTHDEIENLPKLLQHEKLEDLTFEQLYSSFRVRNHELRVLEIKFYNSGVCTGKVMDDELRLVHSNIKRQLLCVDLLDADKIILREKLEYVEKQLGETLTL
eukprot:snap_masked-scaffold_6-processed-gene-1.34-mRNA-1 protein AED:1.00 eAED:1.00 QI:0/0/0/0/1/1/2/0/422